MRVAVVGGTGLVGAEVVKALEERGDEPVVVARSRGVDVLTGEGLDRALDGVDAVIDVTNTAETDPAKAVEFFGSVSGNLVEAERGAGVPHHVLLSIVGLDRVEGNGHYAGKRRQEEVAEQGAAGFSLLRATQFFEFAAMVVEWTREGEEAKVPPLLVQPVAVRDVALALVELAAGEPGARQELAGPLTEDLVDMARRTLAARGESIRLEPTWQNGVFGAEMAGEVLLPSAQARHAETTFDAWLAAGS